MRSIILFAMLACSTATLAKSEKPRNLLLRDLVINSFDYRAPNKELSPGIFEDKKGHVLFFVRSSCPLAKLYVPRLKQMIEKYHNDYNFFVVFPGVDEKAERIAKEAIGNIEGAILVLDSLSMIAREADITTSPTILLLDTEYSPIYEGPIDDQYSIDGRKPAPTHNYLEDRLSQIKEGHLPAYESKKTQGCEMKLYRDNDSHKAETAVTYYSHIKPIIERGQCLKCHRSGNIAEFQPLDNYDDVSAVAMTAALRIASRRMPPWQADPRYGDFHDAKRLSAADIHTFLEWTKAGTPKGVDRDDQSKVEEHNQSAQQKPDRVWSMLKPFEVPDAGVLEYKYFLVDSGLENDTWVSSVNVLPGAPSVVHHSRLFVIPPDMQISEPSIIQRILAKKLKLSDDQIRWGNALWGQTGNDPSPTALGSYTPGTDRAFAPDMGVLIPKGSQILFEQHYTTNGTAAADQTKVSVKFSDTAPKYQILELPLGPKFSIKIPPGDANYSLVSEYIFPRKAKIVSFRPHMHLRGKSFRLEIIKPGKDKETLLWIPRWDFKWQTYYEFKTPIDVEPDTKIISTAVWDNSADNPSNPDPTQEVTFGPNIDDEMAMSYMTMTWAD